MKLTIEHQESYSRGELILRTLFGFIYIMIPHAFLLAFVGIGSGVLNFLAFWVVLFTGEYPQSWFEFQVKYMKWNLRVSSAFMNLIDDYPAFGLKGDHKSVQLEIPYPPGVTRGSLLIRTIFGAIYVGVPHMFCLAFRMIATEFLMFLAWWVVLFTGSYPASWHTFNVGTMRWSNRVSLYMAFMMKDYPPFSGKE
jgi:hypothetical protein